MILLKIVNRKQSAGDQINEFGSGFAGVTIPSIEIVTESDEKVELYQSAIKEQRKENGNAQFIVLNGYELKLEPREWEVKKNWHVWVDDFAIEYIEENNKFESEIIKKYGEHVYYEEIIDGE